MDRLQEISLRILYAGIVRIRELAYGGDNEAAHAEAEHLHNLPAIISDEKRGGYWDYVGVQRLLYIRWVQQAGREDVLLFVKDKYLKLWEEMDQILASEKKDES
jgi:hypothetical protein